MISNEEIKKLFEGQDGVEFVNVEGDGYHYQITIVSDQFINKGKVKRQQWVYARLNQFITSGSLHALSMKTFTKDEWEKQNNG